MAIEKTKKAKATEVKEEVAVEKPPAEKTVAFGIAVSSMETILKLIGTTTDEVRLDCSREGIGLRMVDPAHVNMLEMMIPAQWLSDYRYINPDAESESYSFGLDIRKLREALKPLKKETAELAWSSTENKLTLKAGRITRKIGGIDITGMSTAKLPNLNLAITVEIDNGKLSRALTAVGQVSDHIIYSSVEKPRPEMLFLAHGDLDEVEVLYTKEQDDISVSGGKAKSMYPIDYLHTFSAAIPKDTKLSIAFGKDYPQRIDFQLFDGAVACKYLLAPRIDTDSTDEDGESGEDE